jgi:hypothetical protein
MPHYKTIILHCGIHKTGSSYLQTILASNRDVLAAHSIHYPDYRDLEDRMFGPQHSIVAVDYDATKSFDTNFDRVFTLNSNCETLLLSGEELSRISAPSFFDGLRAMADEVTALFYLRRFDHLLESVYAESVKDYLVGPIEAAQYQLEFYEILRPFVTALGTERVKVRPYNSKLWSGGSLGQDFCTAIGFPMLWNEMSKPAGRINDSLSRPETYMLSVTDGIEDKQHLLARFRDVPFLNYDAARFFRSSEYRTNFNNIHIDANAGILDFTNGMPLIDFLDLDNFNDDQNWKPFDPSDHRIKEYLDSFRRSLFMHETLDTIGKRHGTDKGSNQNNFLNFYDRFLASMRDKPIKLLEIGVLNGGSVRTWKDYFRNGKIVGVDIDPGTKAHEQDRIRIKILDQSKFQDLDLLVAEGPFDVIVDDGSHVWTHQILTFQKLIGTVTPGGFYIVEDLDTSYGKYVPNYHGGATESAAAYLQRLARLVVGQRVLNLTEEPDVFQRSLFPRIDFITFYRGAALVRLKE